MKIDGNRAVCVVFISGGRDRAGRTAEAARRKHHQSLQTTGMDLSRERDKERYVHEHRWQREEKQTRVVLVVVVC